MAKREALDKNDKLVLITAGALCVAKAILEAEAPLMALAGPALAKEAQRVFTAGAVNFVSMLNTAEKNDTLPQLRKAVAKAVKGFSSGGE